MTQAQCTWADIVKAANAIGCTPNRLHCSLVGSARLSLDAAANRRDFVATQLSQGCSVVLASDLQKCEREVMLAQAELDYWSVLPD